MKITQLRDKDKTTALTTIDIETWIEKVRTEIKSQPVSTFRAVFQYVLSNTRCNEADKLPKILPAAEFRKIEGSNSIKSYNIIIKLTVSPLTGRTEIALVKQRAWEQPQTALGRTVSPLVSTNDEMIGSVIQGTTEKRKNLLF